MAKKIGLIICIALLTVLSATSVYQMYAGNSSYELSIDEEKIAEVEQDLSDNVAVSKGNIEVSKKTSVEVVSLNEELLEVYTLEKNDKCFLKKGQTALANTKIFTIDGKDIMSTAKIRCMDIQSSGEITNVTILNFGKLRIKTMFPVEQINDEFYNKTFDFKINGNKVVGQVDYVDYVCQDGFVDVYFTFDSNESEIMYGMTGTYSHTMETAENVLMLPKAYVIVDEYRSVYLVELVQGNETVRKEITIGIYDDNNVQITSGLNEGDVVIFPSNMTTLFEYSENS